jgi:hypothetical protein
MASPLMSDSASRPRRRDSEFAGGGDDMFGHQLQRMQRADADEGAVRDLDAEFGRELSVRPRW